MTDNKTGGTTQAAAVNTEYEPREPEVVRRDGNRLIAEQSAYLQQHARNPIEWFPWGEEAHVIARALDKPIFLSVGYSSCHWCHVMEEEVFEHDDVARYLNANFICIKLDREERPDIDAVYMDALQLMTGGGGWPMSMFLSPDLKPFFGATYIPKEQFLDLASQLAGLYASDRSKIEAAGRQLYDYIAQPLELKGTGTITSELIAAAADRIVTDTDMRWGGKLAQQKFPSPLEWRFLLHFYRKTGEPKYAEAVRLTLDNMGSGGIHDHIAGGFHRYTVESTWLIPHFEKMLYDNAQLAGLYTEAWLVFKDERYGEIARDTLDFLVSDMSEGGAFFASFDADSGGEEGTYYTWTPDELVQIAGERDGAALAELLGVTEQGNFEGASVLTRRASIADVARQHGLTEKEAAGLFGKWRLALDERRRRRVAPGLDKKVVTAWNGLALSAFAQGYSAFGDRAYLAAAESAAEYLWDNHRMPDGGLYRHSSGGDAADAGVLDDYAFLGCGLLDLFQASGDARYLGQALELIDYAYEHFGNRQGGFYYTPAGHEAPLGRQVKVHDMVKPSGNSAMLQAIMAAAALTGETRHYEALDQALAAYFGLFEDGGTGVSWWLDLALRHQGPFYEVVIVGQADDPVRQHLLEQVRALGPANAVVAAVPGGWEDTRLAALMPVLDGKKLADDGSALAYVCIRGSCKSPTGDPKEFRRQLLDGWQH